MTTAIAPRQFLVNRLIWYAIIAVAVFDGAWMAGAHIALDIQKALIFFPVFAVCFLLSLAYRYWRRDDRVFLLGSVTNQMLSAAAALGILSYLTAGMGLPLADGKLIAADRLLFFDWPSYIAWINGRPWLATVLEWIYVSTGPQIIGALFLLFLCNQTAHCQRFIIGFFSSALVIILCSGFYPALGGYSYYHIDLSQFPHLHPIGAQLHEEALASLRASPITLIAFPLSGVVMFPSFHSALAALLVYASWPLRFARWIALSLNMAVLLSTPVQGGHYLADVLAGLWVAAIVVPLAEWLLPRAYALPSREALP